MIRYVAVAACAAMFIVLPAQGAVPECSAATTQSEMSACADIDYKAADAVLAKAYRELMTKNDGAGKIILRDAERAWISYRDKECAFETARTSGGSIHPMMVSVCLTGKTNTHIEDLKAHLICEEGDLSC